MHRLHFLLCGALVASCSSHSTMSSSSAKIDRRTAELQSIRYPMAPRGTVVDDYRGTQVADPYRSLEDPDAPDTRTWIEAENAITRAWIDAVPERAAIEERLTELWNYARYQPPQLEAKKLFFWKNDGLQNQAVLYVADGRDESGRPLLDPNSFRADGTTAVTTTRANRDGTQIAYALSEAGSDWNVIRVRDIATGKDLDDRVEWVKFSNIAWATDGSGFWYSTYPTHDTTGKVALERHTLYFHALGTAQSADKVAFEAPDHPTWGFGGDVTDDGNWLVIVQSEGTEQKNRVLLKDLRQPSTAIVKLLDDFDAEYELIHESEDRFWFRTDNGAARNRIVAIDVRTPSAKDWHEVVAESKDTIESAIVAGGRLLVTYLVDAKNELRVFELDGKSIETVKLPAMGSISELRGDAHENDAYFAFSSFTTPTAVWRYDVLARAASAWRAPKVAFDPQLYVTEQVFYASKDKTRVPLFVTHRSDVKLTAGTPTLLYGYGGFNISLKPTFSPAILAWMERGGTYAVANLRGGGEYGREWHEAGTLAQKQNVFDDFIGAAEFLIAQGWTSAPKLAIHGRSNGGLLVGACMTQRPDLFGACIPGVGVLDMLRYHTFTIGWAWASDYGRSDDPEALPYLLRYSPLHNVKSGVAYPPTLVTTGDHDDRVVPAHSFKFAAELQSKQTGSNPILIRIETRGGHGAGKPTAMQIEEIADQWAFLTRALGISAAP